MPRSKLLDAINATNTDAPAKAKPARKRPGPAPRLDEDGKKVVKARQTRAADLHTEDEKKAQAEALNAMVEEWIREDAELEASVLAARPGLEGEELRQAIFSEQSRRHNERYSQPATAKEDKPAASQATTQAPAKPLEVTRQVHDPYLEVLSDQFTASQMLPVPDGSPFGTMPAILTRTFRIAANPREYILQEELADGRWVEASRAYELGGVAFLFAYRQLHSPEFHELASKLPTRRPERQAQLDAVAAKGASRPLSAEDRRQRNEEVMNQVAAQRDRWRETGMLSDGPAARGLNWLG